MAEPLKIGTEYFRTTDRVLAEALLLADCKPAPFQDYGPAMNIYNRQMFFRESTTASRVEAAVFRAFTRKNPKSGEPEPWPPGIVVYLISRDPPFEEFMKAWDAIPEEMHDAKQANRPPIFPDVKAADVARVKFLDRLQKQELERAPWIQLPVIVDGKIDTQEVPMKLNYPLAAGVPHPVQIESEGSGMIWNWKCGEDLRRKAGMLPLAPEIKAYLAGRK